MLLISQSSRSTDAKSRDHEGDGLLLRIPYRDSRELVMDMRRGAHVEVIEPSALREEVRQQLETAARQYS